VGSKVFCKIFYFKKIRNEAEFFDMVHEWMNFLEKKGDVEAKDWLAMERHKIELFTQLEEENEDY
jgi:hypothetical protein